MAGVIQGNYELDVKHSVNNRFLLHSISTDRLDEKKPRWIINSKRDYYRFFARIITINKV